MSSTQTSRSVHARFPAALAVFARAPVAGRSKTRLIPLFGPQGAAKLQHALILDTTAKVNQLARRADRWLFLAGGPAPEFPESSRWRVEAQRGRALANRLDRAFRQLFREHSRAIVIGTDSPQLTPKLLRLALSELRACEAVLGPCPDGGFYLMGLARKAPRLFRRVRLETRHAFHDVRRALLARGHSCSILPEVPDVDRPQDWGEIAELMTRRRALRASAPALWRFLGAPALPVTQPSKSTRRRGPLRRRRRRRPGRA